MTEPFRMTCQLERKQLPWEYRQWKRVLLLTWLSKTAVIFIAKRNAKSKCWYLRHQIRYISKFFFFFFIFKWSSKPSNPIKTIHQSLFDVFLKKQYLSNRKFFSCVCIAWYKHSRGWENSRQLCISCKLISQPIRAPTYCLSYL